MNTVWTPPSQVTDMAPLSPQNSMPRSSSSSPPPLDIPPCSSQVPLLPTAVSTRYPLYPLAPQLCARDSAMLYRPGFSFSAPCGFTSYGTTFTWGSYVSTAFINSLNAVNSEVVDWRPNLFKVPFDKAGKSFVSELARMPLPQALPWNPSL